MKIHAIMSGQSPPPTSYEDSNQTPLEGNEAQFLRNQWSSGMDYAPYEPMFFYLSDWLKVVWCGNYKAMMKMLENKDQNDVKKIISKRETMLNVSSVFHVIIGARTLYSDQTIFKEVQQLARSRLNVQKNHIKVLKKLISLGVDIMSMMLQAILHFIIVSLPL